MNIKKALLTMGKPVEDMRTKFATYPLSWRVGIAFFISITVLSMVPIAMESMEYYTVYELKNQTVKDITVGHITYENVLVMELVPYQYSNGQTHLSIEKGIFGEIKSIDTNNLRPVQFTSKVTSLYFAEESTTRDDLKNGELIVVRWVVGISGYHVKGVMPLEELA